MIDRNEPSMEEVLKLAQEACTYARQTILKGSSQVENNNFEEEGRKEYFKYLDEGMGLGYELHLMLEDDFNHSDLMAPTIIKKNEGGYALWGYKNNAWGLTDIPNDQVQKNWRFPGIVFISVNEKKFEFLEKGHREPSGIMEEISSIVQERIKDGQTTVLAYYEAIIEVCKKFSLNNCTGLAYVAFEYALKHNRGYELNLIRLGPFEEMDESHPLLQAKKNPCLIIDKEGNAKLFGWNKNWQFTEMGKLVLPKEWTNKDKVFISVDDDLHQILKRGHTHAAIFAQVYYIKNGDHVFVVLNKDTKGKPTKISEAWGDAIICDPFSPGEKVYPVAQYKEKLYDIERIGNKNVPKLISHFQFICPMMFPGPQPNTVVELNTTTIEQLKREDKNREKIPKQFEILFATHHKEANRLMGALHEYNQDLETEKNRLIKEHGQGNSKVLIMEDKQNQIASVIADTQNILQLTHAECLSQLKASRDENIFSEMKFKLSKSLSGMYNSAIPMLDFSSDQKKELYEHKKFKIAHELFKGKTTTESHLEQIIKKVYAKLQKPVNSESLPQAVDKKFKKI